MKKSVGVILLTHIPTDEGERLAAVLQRRGSFNHEDDLRPETYPGCLQVTCHGGVEENETETTALYREMDEELGTRFLEVFWDHSQLRLISRFSDEKKEVVTYGAIVPRSWFKLLKLGPDTGGILYVCENALDGLTEITPEMKRKGPELSATLAMFSDEIKTVRMAFEFLG